MLCALCTSSSLQTIPITRKSHWIRQLQALVYYEFIIYTFESDCVDSNSNECHEGLSTLLALGGKPLPP